MLRTLRDQMTLKGFSVHLEAGILSVSKESRNITEKEVKGLISMKDKRKLNFTLVSSGRFQYVNIEEKSNG